MKIIILAAGYATRLEPLTLTTPKSLLEVGRKKIIDRILEKIAYLKGGVDSICIVTNAKFFNTFNEWLRGSKYAEKASLLNDGSVSNETRLGAIKDLELVIAEKAIDDDLLVVAGDNLFDLDLNKFIEFARSRPDGVSVALYDIKSLSAARSFGVLKTDAAGRVTDFEEKPAEPKSTLISTGIYYFPKNKLAFIKEYVKMRNKLDAPGYYISWLVRRDKVYGYSFSEDWYDIGSLESLKKADADYLKKEI
jgi:glucose-1-phosphate thymidylyltransferase